MNSVHALPFLSIISPSFRHRASECPVPLINDHMNRECDQTTCIHTCTISSFSLHVGQAISESLREKAERDQELAELEQALRLSLVIQQEARIVSMDDAYV